MIHTTKGFGKGSKAEIDVFLELSCFFDDPAAAAAAVTSVVSDSVRPHRQQPTRLPHPWDSPGRNTEVGRFPFPGNLPDPAIESGSSALQADYLLWMSPGKLNRNIFKS